MKDFRKLFSVQYKYKTNWKQNVIKFLFFFKYQILFKIKQITVYME